MVSDTDSDSRAAHEAESAKSLVSVVIPCYLGAKFLAEAIESCLGQTYTNLEIIVVDDASPDACGEIAAEYARKDPRVRLIQNAENRGVSRTFNAGFEAARGDYFTRLAQDDLFEPDAIARMVIVLRDAPAGAGLTYCDYRTIDDAGAHTGEVVTPEPRDALKYKNRIGLCVMWTRRVWSVCGSFDSRYDMAEDFEYWLRVSERFALVKCPGAAAMRVRFHREMGTLQFASRQTTSWHNAIIDNARRGRFRFDRRWTERQIAVARVHQARAYLAGDQNQFGRSLYYTTLSLVAWPWTFPEYARDGRPPWARARMFFAYSTKLMRSLADRLLTATRVLRRGQS